MDWPEDFEGSQITSKSKKGRERMWVLVVQDEDAETVHVYGGPWETEEEGNEKAREFIEKTDALSGSDSLRLTVTQIEPV